jgi:hypothetical protein
VFLAIKTYVRRESIEPPGGWAPCKTLRPGRRSRPDCCCSRCSHRTSSSC